jgi:hypothetical protein
MQFTKKASLNLSINAIVILILAITMLGLGLAFMRNIFGSATQEFSEVSGTVKKQMIDQMKESEKIVDVSNPKMVMKAGENKQVFMGFKNEGNNPVSFQIRVVESSRLGDPADEANTFTVDKDTHYIELDPVTVGACGVRVIDDVGSSEQPAVNLQAYIEFKNTPTKVEKGDVAVVPMNIHTTSGASQGTCIYELKIDIDADNPTDPDYGEIIELTVDITS